MLYRPFGRTDLRVSALSLGTMTFGEQNTEAEGHALMDRAVAAGANLFDAAELYPIPPRPETQGRTEEIIGSWLRTRGGRDRMLIATKAVGRTGMGWFRGGPAKLDRANLTAALERSLRLLGTDYVDLYQMHWPDRIVTGFGSNPTIWRTPDRAADEVPIAETLAVLADFVKAGKVRHVGVSNESAWGVMSWLAAAERFDLPRIVSVQNAYSLVNRTFEGSLAEVAEREKVGLVVYSALAQGFLTGKYRDGTRPTGSRVALFDRQQRYQGPHAAEAVAAYCDLAAEAGLDPAQMALAFAMSRPFTTTVLVGATTMAQLETDLGAADVTIGPELEAKIDAIHRQHMNPCP
jgi:aryl-alcohol dehydrogenase-like predicted oxidoreductase